MLGISALMALSDAVAACGDGSVYPALDAPATAERVLMAVRRVEAGHDFSSKNRGVGDA
jgi:xanthine dehydrogenase large subunit